MKPNLYTFFKHDNKKVATLRIALYFSLSLLACIQPSLAQPSYTANDKVVDFGASFGYGVNPGYYGDISSGSGFDREGISYDVALAQLARKVGINALRPSLPAYFFLQFGNSTNLGVNNFALRTSEFSEYQKLGISNHTVFIGDATDHQDGSNVPALVGNQYRNVIKYPDCANYSYEFKNLYEPIWDNGANGTPVNDNNYYALYIYKLATTYKGQIKVYEVINEIDFKGTGNADPSGKAGSNGGNNWFDRNPTPCELLNWRAPVFSYIRLLRITYEVVKTVDPNAFIATGGIGYESFLDVIMRNTDNPSNGSVDAVNYPKKGGAYFDVLSYHWYPQYDMKKKDSNGNNIYPFVYLRESDEAAERTVNKKDRFQSILANYGYDGTVGNFPAKHFIITETNIPRRTYSGQDWIGSDDAQKNFAVKVMIKAQKKGIKQIHLFKLGESNDLSDVSNMEGHEGLYQNLKKAKRTNATKTSAGKALQTATAILDSMTYDAARTTVLALAPAIDGAAFKSKTGKYIYVLWARTATDNSETASTNFTFPIALNINGLHRADWDYSLTGTKTVISSSTVALTGSPSYFTDASNPLPFNTAVGQNFLVSGIEDEENARISAFYCYPNPFSKSVDFSFELARPDVVSLDILSLSGNVVVKLADETNLAAGQQTLSFDDLDLPPGLYLGKVYSKKTGYKSVIKLAIEQ